MKERTKGQADLEMWIQLRDFFCFEDEHNKFQLKSKIGIKLKFKVRLCCLNKYDLVVYPPFSVSFDQEFSKLLLRKFIVINKIYVFHKRLF